MNKINLTNKLNLFNTHWEPKIIAELNGQYVKLAKFKGEFDWHKHDSEDEMFLVIRGSLEIQFRDKTEKLNEGEMIVIPRGVEHCPKADKEVHVMLFEPKSVLNTGDAIESDKTVNKLEWL
jgi:mannose-6-phosphate isomerase-like protein (cupin superfamily)